MHSDNYSMYHITHVMSKHIVT